MKDPATFFRSSQNQVYNRPEPHPASQIFGRPAGASEVKANKLASKQLDEFDKETTGTAAIAPFRRMHNNSP